MADTIDISAVARVVDQASGPLQKIQGAIANTGKAAQTASAAMQNMARPGIFSRIGGAIQGIGQRFARLGSIISQVASPLAGLMGVGGIGAAMAGLREYTATAAGLARTAGRLGMSVEGLQVFQHLAGDSDTANTALSRLQKTMTTITSGSKAGQSLVPLFRRMGVSMQEIRDGNLDVILPKIANAFQRNVNPVTRARMALALFGRQGQQLIPMLSRGEAGLAEVREQLEEMGLITGESAAEAVAAQRQWRLFDRAIVGVKNAIAGALLPAVMPAVTWLAKFISANRGILAAAAVPALIAAIATAVLWLGSAVAAALGPWGLLALAIATAATAIYQNWGRIREWMDRNFGGIATTLENLGRQVFEWARGAVSRIGEAFRDRGVLAGLQQIWIEWRDAATAAATAVREAFANIDWAGVWNSLQDSFRAAWAALVEQVRNIDWHAVGLAIGDAIGRAWKLQFDILEWLTTLDWAAIGRTAGELLGTAFVAIVKGHVAVYKWLGQAIAEADWPSIALSVVQGLGNLVVAMTKLGADMMLGLIEGMLSAIPGLSQVTNAIRNMLGRGAATEGVAPAAAGDGAAPAERRGWDQGPIVSAGRSVWNRLTAGGGEAAAPITPPVVTGGTLTGQQQQPSLLRHAIDVNQQEVEVNSELRIGGRIELSPDLQARLASMDARISQGTVSGGVEVGQSMASAQAIA